MLSRVIHIPTEVDLEFRSFLLGVSPEPVRQMLDKVLADGPQPDGAKRAAVYFGLGLQDALIRTVAVVDEIEWFRPGFKKWLDGTGFGNEPQMIAAFSRWAEMESRGDLRHGLRERTKH